MFEQMERAKSLTQNAPVDYLEIRLEERSSSSLSFSGRELDEIGEKESSGGCVRACHKGGWGFTSFNRPTDLEKAVKDAILQAKAVGSSVTALKYAPPVSGHFIQGEGENPALISLEEKLAVARSYNDIILRGKRVVSSRISYVDRAIKTYLAASNGTSLSQERTFTGITISATARDGVNVQRAYQSIGDHRGFANVRNRESAAEEVVRRAESLLDAPKINGGRYTVILDPKLTGVFAHEAFGHMSEADFISENPAIAAKMTKGTRFGSEILNIVDDGTLLAEAGGYPYDDEGVKAQKTYLIKEGLLSGHLHSRETAAKMDGDLTGNARAISYRFKPIVRMSCTLIENGKTPFEEMISDVKDGIYAVGMLGGNTDLEQFTFSAENAFEIKNGKIGGLIRDVILTGNLFETLHNIDRVGNDFAVFGGMGGCGKEGQSPLPVSDGGPHIRIQNLLIG
ncbi:MAG: TldD/PmbA family protein [Fibrobacteres bacterium]|nr:TldD/PmbA family protein [Fibrobacterota bacterium]